MHKERYPVRVLTCERVQSSTAVSCSIQVWQQRNSLVTAALAQETTKACCVSKLACDKGKA